MHELLHLDRDDSAGVDQFILDEIDSVPHLEALLLLWRNAPHPCTATQIADQLYISHGQGAAIAEDLQRRGLIAREHEGARVHEVTRDSGSGRDHRGDAGFFYDMRSEEQNRLMEAVDRTYRRELIRISGIIHSKPSAGVRAFANAFRFRKDKD